MTTGAGGWLEVTILIDERKLGTRVIIVRDEHELEVRASNYLKTARGKVSEARTA